MNRDKFFDSVDARQRELDEERRRSRAKIIDRKTRASSFFEDMAGPASRFERGHSIAGFDSDTTGRSEVSNWSRRTRSSSSAQQRSVFQRTWSHNFNSTAPGNLLELDTKAVRAVRMDRSPQSSPVPPASADDALFVKPTLPSITRLKPPRIYSSEPISRSRLTIPKRRFSPEPENKTTQAQETPLARSSRIVKKAIEESDVIETPKDDVEGRVTRRSVREKDEHEESPARDVCEGEEQGTASGKEKATAEDSSGVTAVGSFEVGLMGEEDGRRESSEDGELNADDHLPKQSLSNYADEDEESALHIVEAAEDDEVASSEERTTEKQTEQQLESNETSSKEESALHIVEAAEDDEVASSEERTTEKQTEQQLESNETSSKVEDVLTFLTISTVVGDLVEQLLNRVCNGGDEHMADGLSGGLITEPLRRPGERRVVPPLRIRLPQPREARERKPARSKDYSPPGWSMPRQKQESQIASPKKAVHHEHYTRRSSRLSKPADVHIKPERSVSPSANRSLDLGSPQSVHSEEVILTTKMRSARKKSESAISSRSRPKKVHSNAMQSDDTQSEQYFQLSLEGISSSALVSQDTAQTSSTVSSCTAETILARIKESEGLIADLGSFASQINPQSEGDTEPSLNQSIASTKEEQEEMREPEFHAMEIKQEGVVGTLSVSKDDAEESNAAQEAEETKEQNATSHLSFVDVSMASEGRHSRRKAIDYPQLYPELFPVKRKRKGVKSARNEIHTPSEPPIVPIPFEEQIVEEKKAEKEGGSDKKELFPNIVSSADDVEVKRPDYNEMADSPMLSASERKQRRKARLQKAAVPSQQQTCEMESLEAVANAEEPTGSVDRQKESSVAKEDSTLLVSQRRESSAAERRSRRGSELVKSASMDQSTNGDSTLAHGLRSKAAVPLEKVPQLTMITRSRVHSGPFADASAASAQPVNEEARDVAPTAPSKELVSSRRTRSRDGATDSTDTGAAAAAVATDPMPASAKAPKRSKKPSSTNVPSVETSTMSVIEGSLKIAAPSKELVSSRRTRSRDGATDSTDTGAAAAAVATDPMPASAKAPKRSKKPSSTNVPSVETSTMSVIEGSLKIGTEQIGVSVLNESESKEEVTIKEVKTRPPKSRMQYFKRISLRKKLNPLAIGLKSRMDDDETGDFYREILLRGEEIRKGGEKSEVEVDIETVAPVEDDELAPSNPAIALASVLGHVSPRPTKLNEETGEIEEAGVEGIQQLLATECDERRLLVTKMINVISAQYTAELATERVVGGMSIQYNTMMKNSYRLRNSIPIFTKEKREAAKWAHKLLIERLPLSMLATYICLLRFCKTSGRTLIDLLLKEETSDDQLKAMNSLIAEFIFEKVYDPQAAAISRTLNKRRIDNVYVIAVSPSLSHGDFRSKEKSHEYIFRTLLPNVVGEVEQLRITLPMQSKFSVCEAAEFAIDTVAKKVAEVRKKRSNMRIVLAGWGTSCVINHQVVNLVPNVSAILDFAFPLKTAEGMRGSVDDDILLTYCPSLFIIGEEALDCDVREMQRMAYRMKAPAGVIVIGSADNNLHVSVLRLCLERFTQRTVERALLDDIVDFLERYCSRTFKNVFPLRPILPLDTNDVDLTIFKASSNSSFSPRYVPVKEKRELESDKLPRKKPLVDCGDGESVFKRPHPAETVVVEASGLAFQDAAPSTAQEVSSGDTAVMEQIHE
ncbi:KAT8 regulatory NSL complex subunit 3 [Toxocara canis]|uniref:KAT8 regulatory NSL complex subunit 3 n=1 Tax=Toxocara canis TaxID=6265 RepID=A0A0B2VKA4_TOXCA|nr:KAT8 regulatory NSL complex subunit 3 [Toxocara canis]